MSVENYLLQENENLLQNITVRKQKKKAEKKTTKGKGCNKLSLKSHRKKDSKVDRNSSLNGSLDKKICSSLNDSHKFHPRKLFSECRERNVEIDLSLEGDTPHSKYDTSLTSVFSFKYDKFVQINDSSSDTSNATASVVKNNDKKFETLKKINVEHKLKDSPSKCSPKKMPSEDTFLYYSFSSPDQANKATLTILLSDVENSVLQSNKENKKNSSNLSTKLSVEIKTDSSQNEIYISPLKPVLKSLENTPVKSSRKIVSVSSKKAKFLSKLNSSSDEENYKSVPKRVPVRTPLLQTENSHIKTSYGSPVLIESSTSDTDGHDDARFEKFLVQQKSIQQPKVRTKLNFRKNFIVSSDDDDDDDSISSTEDDKKVPDKRNKHLTKKKPVMHDESKNTASGKKIITDKPLHSSSKHLSFLSSLGNIINLHLCHPEAVIYRKEFKKHKEQLVQRLFSMYNENIFENKLPTDMKITWNPRMTKTAGFCYTKKDITSSTGRVARIELSSKVLDSAERVRDTLVHELCHAASWIIHGIRDGHGTIWKFWASKAVLTFPELPQVSRCHHYDIKTKFTYQCKRCGARIGRHSKSLDIKKNICKICHGEFELISNNCQTPRTPGKFALFVKDHYSTIKKAQQNVAHRDVMKMLSIEFQKFKINSN